MKFLGGIACVAALVVAACSPAFAVEIDKSFHETFDVTQGVRLRMDHGDGDVTITPWDKDVIDVKVRYHAEVKAVGFGGEPDFDVDFKQTDDSVIVKGVEMPSSGVLLFHSTEQYEYTYMVSAPPYAVLDLLGDDGDIGVTGWRAGIECNLDDGDVDLADVVGDKVRISLEDGDVNIDGLIGELSVMGDDGDITVMDGKLSHAKFELEDGSIRVVDSEGVFEARLDDGDIDMSRVRSEIIDVRAEDGDVDLDIIGEGEVNVNVTTDDGDVVLSLGAGLSFDFLVTVDDGRVSVDLADVVDFEDDEHRVSGTVAGGEGLIRVRTQDGDVVVRHGD